MKEQLNRTEKLIGTAALVKLRESKVAVFGLGGVGSYTVEALARSGIGGLGLIDHDVVDLSNINRQLIATHATLGMQKVTAAVQRIRDIDPDIQVEVYPLYYGEETCGQIPLIQFDYIVDAIDSVSSKLFLIQQAYKFNIPIISSMGTGNKLHPALFEVSDIYKTSVCPLAKVMRRELRKRNIPHLKVVYSKEIPCSYQKKGEARTPASISFVPGTAGLILAGEVINDLIQTT